MERGPEPEEEHHRTPDPLPPLSPEQAWEERNRHLASLKATRISEKNRRQAALKRALGQLEELHRYGHSGVDIRRKRQR